MSSKRRDPTNSSSKRRGKVRPALIALLIAALVGVGVWYFGFRSKVDVEGSIAANNRGVGHMERFEYVDAEAAFREAVKRNPKWNIAKINLAIAVLNVNEGSRAGETIEILEEVLKTDPDSPHANYTIAQALKHRGERDEAYKYASKFNALVPDDAHGFLILGETDPGDENSPAAMANYAKALKLNPYLNAARYKIYTNTFNNQKQRAELTQDFQQLETAYWSKIYKLRYFDLGPYAEVIGRTEETHPPQPVGPPPIFEPWEQFKVTLGAGTTWWDGSTDGTSKADLVRQAARERFGAAMALFDYDRDGRIDIFLVGAVIRDGKLGNLMLRNEGAGRFIDVTAELGLAGPSLALGCAVADYDNDDFRDLLLVGMDGVRLFRNTDTGTFLDASTRGRKSVKFVDVTAKAGFDKIGGVCLSATWLDIDQDSDLDLFVCRIADDLDGALTALAGKPATGGRAEVWRNIGDAPPVNQDARLLPLETRFLRATEPKSLFPKSAPSGLVLSDFDDDLDLDLLYLSDGQAPALVTNDRLFRFTAVDGFPGGVGNWNGGVVLDVNHDGRSDVLLLPKDQSPQLWLTRPAKVGDGPEKRFAAGRTNSPPLRQATVCDFDADGWSDVIGLSADGKLVLLHNDGQGQLEHIRGALAPQLPTDLWAVGAADLDGDCHLDFVGWSAKDGLKVVRGLDNGNKSIFMELSGRNEKEWTRSNCDGIGCKVSLLAGRFWTGIENVSLTSGPGHSRLPITLGLGKHGSADAVRMLWPDGVPQAEMAWAPCELRNQREINRKPTSCPILLVWDGEKYRYITDFLGEGSVGEMGVDGSVRPPRPEESVKIEPGILRPRDGKLSIKINEPMDELMFIDRLQLVAIDHPKDSRVHPDERFATSEPPVTQQLLVFKDSIGPVKAVDHRGKDVTELLRHRDGQTVSDFHRRAWIGFAEDHYVELDFGDRLSKLKADEKVYLVIAGWTDYPYPESIYAASQAGVPCTWPTFERLGDDGKWKSLGDLGFPAGLPRTITRDVTGLFTGPTCKIRIKTNLQIHWDQIVVSPLAGIARDNVTELEPELATLANRGVLQEIRPNGRRGPVEYDADRTESVAMTPWKGMLTKFGDVTELIQRDDDCFVIGGPGDELTVTFNANKLPPLRDGFERSYVLRTWGYCKDASLTTMTGGRVEPLPFRGKNPYPLYDAADRAKAEAAQGEYRKKWNTRPATGGRE